MSQRIHAADFYSLTQCDRQVYLNHNGNPDLRLPPTPYQAWLREQGRQHETKVLDSFSVQRPTYQLDNLEIGFEITLEFMREGVPAIYQGVLMEDDLVGIPDLLERVEGDSKLGGHYYRPLDIKLAAAANDGHRLQVMTYIALLESIQGVRPEGALLLRLPPEERAADRFYTEEPVAFDEERYAARLSEVQSLAAGREPPPFLSSACSECPWRDHCVPLVEAAHDVSLIPGLRRDVWRVLHQRGLGTLSTLADLSPADILDIKGVGKKTAPAIIHKARALHTGQMIQVAHPALPSPGDDVIFDMESVPGEGIFYLMGTLVGDRYEYELAVALPDEGRIWADFLKRMDGVGGTIYHYGVYERTAVKKLGERHNTAAQAGHLLDRMVDLEKVVKDCAVLPLRSYSLKAVAPWLGFAWMGNIQAGEDSMLEYVSWLEDGQRDHLDRILRYNEDDCRAALKVLEWLRSLGTRP